MSASASYALSAMIAPGLVFSSSGSAQARSTNAMKIQKLVKLKRIGAEFATVLVGEVFFRPFANRQQLASYVGLTPSPFQSGSIKS